MSFSGTVTVPICPCGGTDYTPVLSGTYDRLLSSQYRFSVERCTTCGLARTIPVPDGGQYADGYALTTAGGAFAGATDDGWSERIVEYVTARSTGDRLLDVGCHVGNLVAAAARFGLRAEGVDLDPVATDAGRRLGRPVRCGALDDLQGPYDAVVMNHVLEHIEGIGIYLTSIERLLAPGGRLFVFVPNRRGLMARLMRDRWIGWFPNQHVWHFTPSTLREVVERESGLEAVEITTRGVIEPPSVGMRGAVKRTFIRASAAVRWGDQVEAVFERRSERR